MTIYNRALSDGRNSCNNRKIEQTRGTIIALGRDRRVLIAPLREINLLPIRPINKFSNGLSHMQIDADISEIQRLEHIALARGVLKLL